MEKVEVVAETRRPAVWSLVGNTPWSASRGSSRTPGWRSTPSSSRGTPAAR